MGILKKNKLKKQEHITGSCSLLGRRKNQEDNYLVSQEYDNKRLILVADGLGGLEYGEYASEQVVEVFKNFFVQINNFSDPGTFLSRTALVVASMMMNKSLEDEHYKNSGSTLSGFLVDQDVFYVVNVGDSRVYMYSNKKLKRMTKDQSYVQFLIDKGVISKEEAFDHPKKNIVNSIISSKISDMKTEVSGPHKIKTGDILIACTDGVHDALKDAEIEELIRKNTKKHDLSEIIANKAFDAGSKDNITVCFYKH